MSERVRPYLFYDEAVPMLIALLFGLLLAAGSCFGFVRTQSGFFVAGFFLGILCVLVCTVSLIATLVWLIATFVTRQFRGKKAR